MEKLLTVQQVCDLFQVKRSTVYDWTHIGYIPHYKFPKGIRFKSTEIENWLKRRQVVGREKYRVALFNSLGRQHTFVSGDVATCIHTITVWHSLFPASLRRMAIDISYDILSRLFGSHTGFPRFA